MTPAPPAPVEPATPATSPNLQAAHFAQAPAKGQVIRTSCRMGACSWARVEQVMRSGSSDAPTVELRLTLGDSEHPQDPYPNAPEGVAIRWASEPVPAQVKCSLRAPYAMIGNEGELLKLGPGGVPGASQGLANLYFATCHGEYGDDALLARKFGYNLR